MTSVAQSCEAIFFWSCKLKACYVSISAINFWFIFVKMHGTPPDPQQCYICQKKHLFLSRLPLHKGKVFQCKVISYLFYEIFILEENTFRIHWCQSLVLQELYLLGIVNKWLGLGKGMGIGNGNGKVPPPVPGDESITQEATTM